MSELSLQALLFDSVVTDLTEQGADEGPIDGQMVGARDLLIDVIYHVEPEARTVVRVKTYPPNRLGLTAQVCRFRQDGDRTRVEAGNSRSEISATAPAHERYEQALMDITWREVAECVANLALCDLRNDLDAFAPYEE